MFRLKFIIFREHIKPVLKPIANDELLFTMFYNLL